MTSLMFPWQKWRRKLSQKLKILESLDKNYAKLKKYQLEKLECILSSRELSVSKNKTLKIRKL